MRVVMGWITLGGALLACAGCGFKGPLYLPERNTTVVTHPAPASQREPGAAAPGQPQTPTANKKQKTPPASPPSASTPLLP